MSRPTKALIVLFAVNTLNFFDRNILGAVGELIRREWGLSDSALGALGTAFTLLYAAAGLPLGRISDRLRRTRILAAGVFVWSLFTALSGLARNFWQLFAARLGVGVGEASCAPASASLIGDLVPAHQRARALSIFMMGLPVGAALSFAVSGTIARYYGWRSAFFVAGLPGLFCAAALLYLREPVRGAAEKYSIGERRRPGSPILLVLSLPTMWWLILSGALHNFNMYAIASFLTPFLMRFHHVDVGRANLITTLTFGLCGIPGLIFGGMAADAWIKRRSNGRILVGAASLLLFAPACLLALQMDRGETLAFSILMGVASALMYPYYSSVYPAIQDVIEPSLRGTAMALYFFGMYVLGASLGPLGTGLASDYFTAQAARQAGVAATTYAALEPFRAQGLHSAMYVIPVLGFLLALVLFAASRTVGGDMGKLQRFTSKFEN